MSKTIIEKLYHNKDNTKRIRVYLSYETGKGYFTIGFQENIENNGLISCDIFNCGYYKHCIIECNRPSKIREKTAMEWYNEFVNTIAERIAKITNMEVWKNDGSM